MYADSTEPRLTHIKRLASGALDSSAGTYSLPQVNFR